MFPSLTNILAVKGSAVLTSPGFQQYKNAIINDTAVDYLENSFGKLAKPSDTIIAKLHWMSCAIDLQSLDDAGKRNVSF